MQLYIVSLYDSTSKQMVKNIVIIIYSSGNESNCTIATCQVVMYARQLVVLLFSARS